MASVVVLDHPGDAQGALQGWAAGFDGLHVSHTDAVGVERDHPRANVKSLLALEDGDQIHPADGTLAGLVGLNPGVHRALVIKDFSATGRVGRGGLGGGMPLTSGEPAATAGQKPYKQDTE